MSNNTIKNFGRKTNYCFKQLFFLIFLLMFSINIANAAKVHLTPKFLYKPIWSNSSIDLTFEANEKLCRQTYGDKWKEKCNVFLGKIGSIAEGIESADWPEGYWKWTNSNKLSFYPTSSWKSETNYTVDVSSLELPQNVELTSNTAKYTSIPRCAQIANPRVWIDPSKKAQHAISFNIRFTESINENLRKTLENNSQIMAAKNSGLELAKSEWIWLEDYTRAVVNAKILNLPKQKSIVSLTLKDIRPIWLEGNTWNFPIENATNKLTVQGTNSLFTLKNVNLEKWQNKSLQMENHLVFKFSQIVSPEELAKSLTVLELPLYRSEENIIKADWAKSGISEEIKQNARKITPQLVQIPNENAEFVRFRLDTSPNHYVYWNVAQGFGPTNDKGVKTALERSIDGVQYISQGNARIDLLQAGNVLMQGSDIAILSEDIDTIKWTAYRFKDNSLALPFINNLKNIVDKSSLYANSTATSGEIVLNPQNKNESYTTNPIFSSLSANKVFADAKGEIMPGLINLSLEGIKDGKVVASFERLLMYSNMGLVVKTLPNKIHEVYVCSINDTKALSGIEVQVLGANGIMITSSKTDKDGKAVLPDLSNFTKEKAPTAIVIRKKSMFGGEDLLWLSLNDYTRYVNMSSFMDKQGKQSSINSLNAFVFAERGLFRPGESLNFGTLLRANDWTTLPHNMPLIATIFDSSNRKVYQERFSAGENIHSFTWQIPQNALTGEYRLSVGTPANNANSMGIVLGSQMVQVENFVPDSLKIKSELVEVKQQENEVQVIPSGGWLVSSDKAENTALQVELKTLFGQAAANRRVASNMRLYPARLNFKGYESYKFQDTNPFFSGSSDPITRTLKEVNTDKSGKAILALDFSQWRFGTLQCFITTEGFEPDGGRSVMTEKRFLLSPMPYMLGYKPGEFADNMDFITKGNAAKLEFVAISHDLKPYDAGNLVFSLSKRQPVTSLVTDSQGRYTYAQTVIDKEVSKQEQSLNGNLSYELPTSEVGEFLLTIKESKENGLVLARIPYSIVGNDDLRPALLSNEQLPPAKLHIKTDKKSYNGGDTAKIMVTAPYQGVALISLERDSVVSYKWVEVSQGNSMHELDIPSDFTGRGYVQVLMGRSPKSEEIFLQSQGFAMSSIDVNVDSRNVALEISAPKEVLPGKNLQFKVVNTAKKPTKAIVYAVDEGILQLSVYKTPKPLDYLLLDRALEVRTAQLFDLTMPTSEKIMKRLSAFGGGAGELDAFAALLGTFQNPFKRNNEAPLTWWSGVVDIPSDGLDLEIKVPSYYNGNVRIIAIAQTEKEVGSTSNNVFVKGDQVLTPQLPSAVALGDNFEAGLAITNTTDKEINLSISAKIADESQTKALNITNLAQTVSLKAKEEKLLPFNVSVGKTPGSATIKFSTKDDAGNIVERDAYISVRPASLARNTQRSLSLSQPTAINLSRKLLPYDAQTSLTLSYIPVPLLNASLSYLQNYQHNCVEQIISKAFALVELKETPLYMEAIDSISALDEKSLEKNVDKANGALISAFNPYQGVSLWTDRFNMDLFLSAYAADYLLALKDAGLNTPIGMMSQLFNYLSQYTNRYPTNINELRANAYAAWVLARAGYVVTTQLEMCENYIKKNEIKSDIANTLMAGAYQAIFMVEDAKRNLAKVKGDAPNSWTSGSDMFDLLAQYGLHSVVLAKEFPSEFKQAIPFLQDSFMAGLNKTHATLGAAMTARGLIEILKASANNDKSLEGIEIACTSYSNSASEEDSFAESFNNLFLLDAPNCTRFSVKIPKGPKIFAQIQEYGYDTVPAKDAVANGLKLTRTLTNITKGEIFNGSINQGDVLRVDIALNLLDNNKRPVVMVDLLPGGFELVLNHKDDTKADWNLSLYREEDRVIAYADVTKNELRITYHLRAINKGTYSLPSAYAEGLFDRNLQSRTTSSKVKVLAP